MMVPEGWDTQISRRSAHEHGKNVSPRHRPSLPTSKYSWYSFILEAELIPAPYCGRKDYVNEKFQSIIGNRTRKLSSCSANSNLYVPQIGQSCRHQILPFRQDGIIKCNFLLYVYFLKLPNPIRIRKSLKFQRKPKISLVFTVGNPGNISYVTCYHFLVLWNSKSGNEVTSTYCLTQNIGMKDEAARSRFDPREQDSLRCNGFV